MEGYTADTYGEAIADVYDDWSDLGGYGEAATTPMVDFLAGLAAGGTALELGIGTGRVALPLAARGVRVHGVDASESMVARLRAKPGGRGVPVTMGDFADVPVPGPFDLVYVVFNTLFALASQAEQVRCIGNVAARLRPGGRFVVEAFVPDLGLFDRGQRVQVTRVLRDSARLDVSQHDPVTQVVATQHVVLSARGIRLVPVLIRYAWPSELDLMCRLAGLRLAERFGGWERAPFTASSGSHVSVYTRGDQA